MQAPIRVGIDVGGTFTDFIAQGADGKVVIHKVSSTPSDPSVGVIDALSEFTTDSPISDDDIKSLFHGSTVSTNAVIERTGAKTGLLITEGFDAIPVVGTMARPQSEAINPFYTEADDEFLLPNSLIGEVPERIDETGDVLEPLDEAAVRNAVSELRRKGVDAIAVCYLFSFMNSSHEERTLEIIREEHPDCFVSLSSRVIPKIREYSRMSTTSIDAYVGPVLSSYLRELREKFKSRGMTTEQVYLMLSHGGLVPFETATANPCRTLLSGPAAGVQGACFFGDKVGEENLITMDMGGTSCDISIVKDGQVIETKEGQLDRYPLSFPLIEISTIGAGGGTQARVDSGRLRIGPESSGADPGPICYGRGGEIPTITDANIVLGRLNPESILGGEIDMQLERTETFLEQRIADPLSMGVTEAAAAILEIINDKMKKEIDVQLSEYGYDARDFTLFAFGGAGPAHATGIAAKLDISQVIIPPWPGINSAAGLLSTDVRQEYVQSDIDPLDVLSPDVIEGRFRDLETTAISERTSEGFERDAVAIQRKLDLRYEGQGYELTVNVGGDTIDKPSVRHEFDALHENRFGYRSDEPVEIVSYRVTSIVEMPALNVTPPQRGDPSAVEPQTRREVYYPNQDQFVKTPIYERADLVPGWTTDGPLVVEQLDTTTVVEPDQSVRVDDLGNLFVEVN